MPRNHDPRRQVTQLFRDLLRSGCLAEHDDRAAKTGAGQARAEHAGKLLGVRHEPVQLRRAVLEIPARAFVRLVQQRAETGAIASREQIDRAPDPLVFADDVGGAAAEQIRQLRQLLRRRVAQSRETQRARSGVRFFAAPVVFAARELATFCPTRR